MNIGWVVPCPDMYAALLPYHPHIQDCNWPIHIFHDHQFMENAEAIYQPDLADLPRLRRHYAILHYFLDGCEDCRRLPILHLVGQKVFVSFSIENVPFRHVLRAYLRG